MTNLDITGQRLYNQSITETQLKTPVDVVERLVAVQSQDYAGAKWSLGLRLQASSDAEIDADFASGAILRTHVMRPTWHFVTPSDIRWLLALTAPRVHAANAFMYRKLGLDSVTLQQSNAVLVNALRDGKQLTRDELSVVLEEAGIAGSSGMRLAYLMMYAELEGLICSGARRGKQFTYALLEERVPAAKTLGREQALAELAGRYFVSRGPATVQDFAKWSGLTVADATRGLEAVKGQLQHEKLGDQSYWFPSPIASLKNDFPVVHLLSIYDEYISSYKDRSAIGSDEVGAKLGAMGNALWYVVVVDGQIVGTWNRDLKKDAVVVAINLFSTPTQAEMQAVALAAQRYGEFLKVSVVLTGLSE